MAIVKTTITGTSWATQFADVLEWLQIYATDYFDTITGDSSTNTITMAKGNTSLVIKSNNLTVTLENGTVRNFNIAVVATNLNVIYKTASGIYMYNPENLNCPQIWITKSNAGNTCVMLYHYGNSSSDRGYAWADLTASPSFSSFSDSPSLTTQTFSASLTALTPFVFTGGVYSDNLFLQTFNEYYGISGIFSINKTQYVSNGYIALKD